MKFEAVEVSHRFMKTGRNADQNRHKQSFGLLVLFVPCLLLSACALEPNRAQQILGLALPASATDILTSDRAGVFGGDYYLSARLTREEFTNLVAQLQLRHRPGLLEYWPAALEAQQTPWWTVTVTNDQDTYFSDQTASTYLVARYEKGRLFFKRHVY